MLNVVKNVTKVRRTLTNTRNNIRPEVTPLNPDVDAPTLPRKIHSYHGDSYKENMAPKISWGPGINVERVASSRNTFEVKQNLGSCPSRTFERHEYDRTENIYYHHQLSRQSYGVKLGNKNGHDFDYGASIYQGPPQIYSPQQGYKSDHEYARRASIFHPQSPQRYGF
ncbi:hypothetical protein Tco_0679306 [Tanacetum coccineum]|uniref:Uncharacterized protein n=1 Tax=Tanacetum coccineum TaxID=301880 RepID=A0ABQ4XHK5_9ASTR